MNKRKSKKKITVKLIDRKLRDFLVETLSVIDNTIDFDALIKYASFLIIDDKSVYSVFLNFLHSNVIKYEEKIRGHVEKYYGNVERKVNLYSVVTMPYAVDGVINLYFKNKGSVVKHIAECEFSVNFVVDSHPKLENYLNLLLSLICQKHFVKMFWKLMRKYKLVELMCRLVNEIDYSQYKSEFGVYYFPEIFDALLKMNPNLELLLPRRREHIFDYINRLDKHVLDSIVKDAEKYDFNQDIVLDYVKDVYSSMYFTGYTRIVLDRNARHSDVVSTVSEASLHLNCVAYFRIRFIYDSECFPQLKQLLKSH